MLRIYVKDKPLEIVGAKQEAKNVVQDATVFSDQLSDLPKLLNNLSKPEIGAAVLVCADERAAMDLLKSELKLVKAAGGMVCTPNNEVLLIFRKGKWDLPKGKLDEGEDLATCALREIEEETGATHLTITQPLITTYHTYREKGEHILKESHWYLVHTTVKSPLQPQIEEDILESKWVLQGEVEGYKSNMHSSVKDVLDAGLPLLRRSF